MGRNGHFLVGIHLKIANSHLLLCITSSNDLCCTQSNVDTTLQWWNYRYEFCAMSCVKEFWFEFVELGLSQVRRHLTFLHNPATPTYGSLQVSRSECICTVAFAKYSTQSAKRCTLVTDQRHKLEICSTVTRTAENKEHSTGFTWYIRISNIYIRLQYLHSALNANVNIGT